MGLTGEEGRRRVRKFTGSSQTSCDPYVSEWGNPISGDTYDPTSSEVGVRRRTQGIETS